MNARTQEQRDAKWLHDYGSMERVIWIKNQKSLISDRWPCVNAHTRTGGTSTKAHYTTIIPITDIEHQLVHNHGWSVFGLTLDALDVLAAFTENRWRAYQETRSFAW